MTIERELTYPDDRWENTTKREWFALAGMKALLGYGFPPQVSVERAIEATDLLIEALNKEPEEEEEQEGQP